MSLVINDEKFLEKFDLVQNKIYDIMGIKFDKKTVYSGKYLNTTLKCYNGKINKDFHGNKNSP